jgi:hypothetical protein
LSEAFVDLTARELSRLRSRVLSYYFAVIILCFLGIGLLILYVLRLGSLVGPGVEESLGLALSIMFLLGALLMHILDRTYREWPLGRRIHPASPPLVTDDRIAAGLRVLVLVAAAVIIAYVVWGVVS